MTIQLINNTSIALANYNRSLATRNYQNDQYQSFILSSHLSGRIVEFCATIGFPFASKGLLTISGVTAAIGFAATYLKPEDREPLNCSPSQMIGRVSYHLLQRGDLILNTAFAVHYLYQLTLGVQLAPLIGITTLALLALKNYALLPHSIEKPLLSLSLYSNIVSLLTYPVFSFVQTTHIVIYLFSITFHHLTKTEEDYLQGEHTVTPLSELPPSNFTAEIDPNYIFNKEVGNLFPLDSSIIPSKEEFERLFKELEEHGCLSGVEDITGWNLLKAGLINECFRGTPPANLPLFKQLMHAILQSTVENNENKTALVKELNQIGTICTDGWTRELTFMYHPKSKEIGWAVHRILAEYRGHLLQEKIQQELRKSPTTKLLGGENNIHLMNAYHFTTRHHLRTLQGEVEFKKNHLSKMNGLYKWGLYNQNESVVDAISSGMFLSKLNEMNPHLVANLYVGLSEKIVPEMTYSLFRSPLSCHRHERVLKEAISDGRIEWQTVANWLCDLHSRIAPNEELEVFFRRYEVRSDRPILNDEGIRLLLLDLNITRLTTCALQPPPHRPASPEHSMGLGELFGDLS